MFAHKRPKSRGGYTPTAVDDEFELVLVCLCTHDHEALEVTVTQTGTPVLVTGNTLCWFGLFEWLTAHLKDQPDTKLLQLWNVKKKAFGKKNFGTARLHNAQNASFRVALARKNPFLSNMKAFNPNQPPTLSTRPDELPNFVRRVENR